MSKADKLYGNPPKMERDKDGHMTVKKPTKADEVQSGTEGVPVPVQQAHERHGMHHRHEVEHMAMHHKHESEHSAHDAAKGGSKEHMHDRHEKEHKEMTERHHKEMKAMHAKHEKGEISGLQEPKKEGSEKSGKEEKVHADKAGEKK